LLSAGLSAGAADRLPAHLYPQNDAFRKEMAELRARGITLTDYHIHIRGGMTPQKAASAARFWRTTAGNGRSATMPASPRFWMTVPVCRPMESGCLSGFK